MLVEKIQPSVYRKPQRLVAEKEAKPISMVGGGRSGALTAFQQAQEEGRT